MQLLPPCNRLTDHQGIGAVLAIHYCGYRSLHSTRFNRFSARNCQAFNVRERDLHRMRLSLK